jgi:CMP-N,N'-diacetyllegionaminic acid synthase
MAASAPLPDILVLLQPTSPLRKAYHVDECVDRFSMHNARSAMSICAVDHHPGKFVVISNGFLSPFTNRSDMEARRQDLGEVFRQNGAIYVVRVAEFLAARKFYCPPCVGYVMPRRLSIDIDDETDFKLTELMMINGRAEEGLNT